MFTSGSKFCEKSKEFYEKQKNFLFCKYYDAANSKKSLCTKSESQKIQFIFKTKKNQTKFDEH